MDIKLKFKSIKIKILFYFSLIVTIVLVSFSFAFYYYFNQSVINSIKNNLLKTAYNIEEKLENNEILNLSKYDFDIEILNLQQHQQQDTKFFINDCGEYLKVKLLFYFDKKEIIITKKIDDKSESIVDTMLILEPILLLLLIFLANKMLDKILIPIKNIINTSKEITINNFKHTIIQNEEYELKELIDKFNEMIKRLQEDVKNLDNFNTNISHELKTPITIIKGEILVTLKKPRSPQEYEHSLISILEEINDIQKITDNLLLLTKYAKNNINETFEKSDLDLILIEVIEKYNKFLTQKNIKIKFQKFQHISFLSNYQIFYHIFSNLIDNAIKFSPHNSNINIFLYKHNNKIFFIIQNQNSFSNNKGSGIGLKIVKYGVNIHNGELKIYSNKKTSITIIF